MTLVSPAAAAPQGDDKSRAYELFEQADQAYRRGDFVESAELFSRAHALDPDPTLLYNVARSYESAGELEKAAQAYRDYLKAQPDASDRGAIERRVETLEAQLAERKSRASEPSPRAAPAPASVPDRPASSGPGVWPWITIGVGSAALVTGGALRLLAESRHSDAEDDPSAESAADKQESAESLARGSGVALIAGAVLVGGGVTWLVLSGERSDATTARWAVAPGPLSVSLRARF